MISLNSSLFGVLYIDFQLAK